jgi:hypothetical protein
MPPGMPPAPGQIMVVNQYLFDILNGAIVIANIILLLLLFNIYLKSYKQIKSKFTIGLVLFVLLLLLQNVLSISFLLFIEGFRGPGFGFLQFFLNITEFIALFILLIITWE